MGPTNLTLTLNNTVDCVGAHPLINSRANMNNAVAIVVRLYITLLRP
jgi:hypothetical protein